MKTTSCLVLCSCLVVMAPSRAADVMPYCGSATMTLTEGRAASIGWLDAYFRDAVTRERTLVEPAPGDAPFERLSGVAGTLGTSTTPGVFGVPGVVRVTDPMREFGAVPIALLPDTYPGVPGSSRSRQVTDLVVDPGNVLASWAPSNDAFGIFVGNATRGEQIAFTGMQRWGGPFAGVLVYGDFALRYAPGRTGQVAADGVLSGLVLTSNIDFLDTSVADLANAEITSDGATLRIAGDLLISGALNVLDPSAAVGTKFGTIVVTTCLARPDVSGDGRLDAGDLYEWERGVGDRDVNMSGAVDPSDRVLLMRAVRCREREGLLGGR